MAKVYKPKNSPFYHYDFQIKKRRFYGSTGTADKREAEQIEKAEREKAPRVIAAEAELAALGVVSLQMNDVTERYWQEVGQYHAGSENTDRDLARLVEYFGKTKLLSEITDADVTALIAWRRAHRAAPHNMPAWKKPEDYPFISNATVNRSTIEVLKKLFTRAKDMWNVSFKHEPKWGNKDRRKQWQAQHILKEPKERVRELMKDEGERLEAAMRADYAMFFAFVRATGLRRKECITLLWSEVNWEEGQIVKLGKDGERVSTPITPYVRMVLEACRGHNDRFVFTYVAVRTIKGRRAGETVARTGNRKTKGQKYQAQRDQSERIKGRRYPLTPSGVKSAWKIIRNNARVEGFRFHDFRHDLASKVLRETGNLKLVSKMLNHADLKSTMKYAHVLDGDIAKALEERQKAMPMIAETVSGTMQNPDTESRNKSRNEKRRAA